MPRPRLIICQRNSQRSGSNTITGRQMCLISQALTALLLREGIPAHWDRLFQTGHLTSVNTKEGSRSLCWSNFRIVSMAVWEYVILFVSPFVLLGFISWFRFNYTKMVSKEIERKEFTQGVEVKDFDASHLERASGEYRSNSRIFRPYLIFI